MESFNAVTVSERILLNILEELKEINKKIGNNSEVTVTADNINDEVKEIIKTMPIATDGGKSDDNTKKNKGTSKKGK